MAEQITAPKIAYEKDEQGQDFVYVPDVCGPFAWDMLHKWAEAIHDSMCPSCGVFAIKAARAVHDAVNFHLGKPIQYPNDLATVQKAMSEALGALSVGQAQIQDPTPLFQEAMLSAHGLRYAELAQEAARDAGQIQAEARQDILDFVVEGLALGVGSLLATRLLDKVAPSTAPARTLPATFPASQEFECTSQLADNAKLLNVDGHLVTELLVDDQLLHSDSIRTIKAGTHTAIVGCLSGDWDGKHCQGEEIITSMKHPMDEAAALTQDAHGQGVTVIAATAVPSVTKVARDMDDLIGRMIANGVVGAS